LRRADSVLPEVRLEGYFKDGRYAAVYQFYWVNGMTTTSDAMSKLLDIVSRLRGRAMMRRRLSSRPTATKTSTQPE
jgi:hypothetical protein